MDVMGELVLDVQPDAVPVARHFVTEHLVGEQLARTGDAELIITELVTNATLHGEAPLRVGIRRIDGRIRLLVSDAGRRMPVIPARSTDSMTGRGLRLVAALAGAWGVDRNADGIGKTVWAELPRPGGGEPTIDEPELDVEELLEAFALEEDGGEELYTVRLGAVPTHFLLEAKAHIDNVIREAVLADGQVRRADNVDELRELVQTVTHDFAGARDEIKRQAIAAAARGDRETDLVLRQPASAADAGERYLAALDITDRYARQAQILTLETPPAHKVFRRWYVQALVDQLRDKAAGRNGPPPPSFLEVLTGEVAGVAALQDAATRLEVLQRITGALTAARTVDQIAAVVVDSATEYLGAASARVFLVDGQVLRSVAVHGGSPRWHEAYDSVLLDADLPGPVVARTGEQLCLRSLQQITSRFPQLASVYDSDRTLHVAPLTIGGNVLGVLSLTWPVGDRLDPDTQAEFVRAMADALAQAVERARAMDAAEAASARLAFLADASVAFNASLDYESCMEAVGTLLVPRLADWCVVQVLEGAQLVNAAIKHFDPEKLAWAERMSGVYPVDMSAATGAPNVLRTGQSELYPDIPPELVEATAVNEEHLAALRQLGIRSALVVPLVGRTGAFGAITLIYAESERSYGPEDVLFVEDVARRAALALEAARMFRDQSGRLAEVRRVAEAAQHAILAQPPARLGRLRLAARYVSATAEALIGGDLYEVVPRPGAVRLLIGDVRGKGLAAVRVATIVLGEFRAAAADLDDLGDVARQIDRRVRAYLLEEDFVTALIAEVRDDGTLTVVSCGHPPALLATASGLRALSTEPSLPLGLGADPHALQVQLAPGDRLLMMTDGVLEARDAERAFLDVMTVASPICHGSLDDGLDRVLEGLRGAVGHDLGDDVALLAAEYGDGDRLGHPSA
jgi:serine phosphatase RsbU (regulator of sigma subunit)/anti-sigma regulatory factor (Ser/Thr protein kinase)